MTRPYVAIRSGEPLHRRSFDVLVLGGGIAGLTAAIGAARRWRVGLLTKSTFEETTTFLAQGGIAAAIGEEDSPELHFEDTIGAGAGLCDEEAVRVLVNEGPDRVRELMEICPRFDKVDGQIVLGREGAHSLPRIVHAGGDATGSEVSSALAEAARVGSRVQLYEDEFVIDLLTVDGRCVGALTLNLADGGLTLNVAMVTVLATGGAGQVYGRTTNPPVATGDGVAMAYRAGAAIRDLEFVQFHPTGLAVPGQQTVQLITEALRGEGAYLRNAAGERFMTALRLARRAGLPRHRRARHGRRDAPRGHGARLPRRHASGRRLAAASGSRASPPGCATTASTWRRSSSRSLPCATTSSAAWSPTCGAAPRCPASTPAARWRAPASTAPTGSPATRCSRVSCSPTASSATSTATSASSGRTCAGSASTSPRGSRATGTATPPRARSRLTDVMQHKVGVLRRGADLQAALDELNGLTSELRFSQLGEAEYEVLNMLTLGTQIAKCALLREESRGVHLRDDFPELDDERWRKHITLRLPAHDRTRRRERQSPSAARAPR